MKRAFLLAVAALSFLAFAAPAQKAEAAVSVGLSVGGRHSGFSLSFQSRPEVVLIPSSRVYYTQDFDQDLYCYGDDWYYVDDGAWFYSRSYRGPFVEIAFTSVPFEVRNVPVGYRRHWGGSNSYYTNRYGTTTRDRSWSDRSQTSTRDRNWGDRDPSSHRDRNYNDRNQGRGRGEGNHGRGNGWGRGGSKGRGRG